VHCYLIPIPKPIQLFEISKYLTITNLLMYLFNCGSSPSIGWVQQVDYSTNHRWHKRGATNYSTHSY